MSGDSAKTIKSIYFNPQNTAYLTGSINELWKASKEKVSSILRKDVARWLKNQEVHQLLKPAIRKFQRNPFVIRKANINFQLDIASFEQFAHKNAGKKYVLVCIDSFSRMAYVYSQKTKNSKETLENFKKLYKKCPTIESILTDEGGEFVSKSFSNFLKSKNISFWTTNNREIKASLAERFIRTLRNKILRHFTANKTQNWTKILANIVKHYNNSNHNSLKMPPSKVTWKNSTQIRRILYPKLTEKQRNYNEKMKNRFYVGRSVRLLRIPGNIFENN